MSSQKPLVLEKDPHNPSGRVIMQRLQPGNDLDIPLADRVERLEMIARELCELFVLHGLDLPPSAMMFLEGGV